MSNNKQTASFPILSIMFLIFMTLKLTHVIDWSWWWVTAPLWGGFALIFTIFIIALPIYALIQYRK